MKSRQFASTGRMVSEIGLGCWQIGGNWGKVSDDAALQILAAAHDHGVTFFDTADVYGGGRSEKLIGRFLRDRKPAGVFVATKLGRSGDPGWPKNFAADVMRRHTEASVQRLGLETVDLTQLHCIPSEELRRGEVFETLRAMQKEGKIRHFGASVESMEQADICLEQPGLSSLQIIFNIFRQKPIDTLFDRAKAKKVALIVRLPVASGLLSGKFTRATQFGPDDHRNFNRDGAAFNVGETFAGLPFEKGVELAERLAALVPAGMSMAQMALRWILDHDAVTTVIPGATRVQQAIDNTLASDLPPLGKDLHQKLRRFYEEQVKEYIRGPY